MSASRNSGRCTTELDLDQLRAESADLTAEQQIELLANSLWRAADVDCWLQWMIRLDYEQRMFVERLNHQSLYRQAKVLWNKRWGQVAQLMPETLHRVGRKRLRLLYNRYYHQCPLPPGMWVHHRDAFAFMQWLIRLELEEGVDRLELHRLEFDLSERLFQFRAFKQPDLNMFLNIRGQLIVKVMGLRFEWLFRV